MKRSHSVKSLKKSQSRLQKLKRLWMSRLTLNLLSQRRKVRRSLKKLKNLSKRRRKARKK